MDSSEQRDQILVNTRASTTPPWSRIMRSATAQSRDPPRRHQHLATRRTPRWSCSGRRVRRGTAPRCRPGAACRECGGSRLANVVVTTPRKRSSSTCSAVMVDVGLELAAPPACWVLVLEQPVDGVASASDGTSQLHRRTGTAASPARLPPARRVAGRGGAAVLPAAHRATRSSPAIPCRSRRRASATLGSAVAGPGRRTPGDRHEQSRRGREWPRRASAASRARQHRGEARCDQARRARARALHRSSAALMLQQTYPGLSRNPLHRGVRAVREVAVAAARPRRQPYQRCTSTMGIGWKALRPSMPSAGASSSRAGQARAARRARMRRTPRRSAGSLHAGGRGCPHDARRRAPGADGPVEPAAAASASRASGTRRYAIRAASLLPRKAVRMTKNPIPADAVERSHSSPVPGTDPRRHASRGRPDDGGATTRPCRPSSLLPPRAASNADRPGCDRALSETDSARNPAIRWKGAGSDDARRCAGGRLRESTVASNRGCTYRESVRPSSSIRSSVAVQHGEHDVLSAVDLMSLDLERRRLAAEQSGALVQVHAPSAPGESEPSSEACQPRSDHRNARLSMSYRRQP